MFSIKKDGCLTSKPSTVKGNIFWLILDPWKEMYQKCHCLREVPFNRGLKNSLNYDSSKVSIEGILILSWMILLFCEDPVVGSLTALECALSGFNKLCCMAEEVFGEDVFSSGRKEGKQNKNLSGKKMTLSYHNVSLQLSPLRTCHWKVCLTCFFFVPTLFYSAAAIFLSQNIVLLNEPKVKLCLLLCLYSDLNAYKDIRRQSAVEVLHIHHDSFTKT